MDNTNAHKNQCQIFLFKINNEAKNQISNTKEIRKREHENL